MESKDAWLEDVKRWYFDEGRVGFEHQLPPSETVLRPAGRLEGPSTPAPRPVNPERPQAR